MADAPTAPPTWGPAGPVNVTNVRRDTAPVDEISAMGGRLLDKLDGADVGGQPADRAIVIIRRGDKGGIAIKNYKSDAEAIDDLLSNVRALLASVNIKLAVILPDGTIK